MSATSVYATPKQVEDLSDCDFYHVTDLPGYGVVGDKWDLRGGEAEYLGGVSFKGKRVLELGTASGFLCRYMESQGAEVVGYDLSERDSWDIVPFSQFETAEFAHERRNHIRMLNNSWWLCHRVFASKAKVVYGSVYNIPPEIGLVDISTFGSILLHIRDPFLALQNALRLARETVIVTDFTMDQPGASSESNTVLSASPVMWFCPSAKHSWLPDTWWTLSPQAVVEMLGVLGFEKATVNYHLQTFQSKKSSLFTVVGTRTREMLAV